MVVERNKIADTLRDRNSHLAVDYALVIPRRASNRKATHRNPMNRYKQEGGVAELAEGGGLEKRNRRFAIS